MLKLAEKKLTNDALVSSVGCSDHQSFYYFLLPDSLRKYERFQNVKTQQPITNKHLNCLSDSYRSTMASITTTISNVMTENRWINHDTGILNQYQDDIVY